MGEMYYPDRSVVQVFSSMRVVPSENKSQTGGAKALSHLEHDVLWRLSLGESKSEISSVVSLSEATIELLVQSAVTKLGAKNTIHAISMLIRNGELGIIFKKD